MKNLIFSMVMLWPIISFCQVQGMYEIFSKDCRTKEKDTLDARMLPWYGDETFLPNYHDSLEIVWQDSFGYIRNSENSFTSTIFRIPVTFWIYRDGINDNNTSNFIPNFKRLQEALDETNSIFQGNDFPIQFYEKCVRFIDVEDVMTINRVDATSIAALIHKDPGSINIHIHAWDDNEDMDPLDGIVDGGNFYNPSPSDAIFMMRARFLTREGRQSVPHEIGHYLGLAHTHQYSQIPCFREPVSRGWVLDWCGLKNCNITGDLLCDTPADPNMSRDMDSNDIDGDGDRNLFSSIQPMPILNGSRYIGNHPQINHGDFTGRLFSPDEFNVMAYANRGFRSHFSDGQRTIMFRNLSNRILWGVLGSFPSANPNRRQPDEFESDNESTTARLISFGERQYHNFHDNSGCMDDLSDWLIIEDSSILGSRILTITHPDDEDIPIDIDEIRIVTTDRDGNILNDEVSMISQSPNSIIISIPCTLDASDNGLRVLLPRLVDSESYEYEVELGAEIVQPDFDNLDDYFCEGNILSVNNLPEGALVNWYGTDMTLIDYPNNEVEISSITPDGIYELFASVELNGCSILLRHFFEDSNPEMTAPEEINVDIDGLPCNHNFTFSINPVEGASYYEWACYGSPNWMFPGCYDESETSISADAYINYGSSVNIYVEVVAYNHCGNSVRKSHVLTYSPETPCNQGIIEIYPNPSTSESTITVIDSRLEMMEYEISIYNHYQQEYLTSPTIGKILVIDTSSYPEGLYFVKTMVNGENVISTLIVQRE